MGREGEKEEGRRRGRSSKDRACDACRTQQFSWKRHREQEAALMSVSMTTGSTLLFADGEFWNGKY